MDTNITHVRMICGQVECLIEGFLLELERVCEIHEDEEDLMTDKYGQE